MTGPGGASRVLVVDDNRDLAENLAEILAEEGFVTAVAFDPFDALALAGDFAFDAAVIDVRMPGMDGVTLFESLAGRHPGAVFVLVTGFTRDERIRHALEAGVRAVLPKPVPVACLLELVSGLV